MATEEDLLCDVCRGGCEPFFYVDGPAGEITAWAHEDDVTIQRIGQAIEREQLPPGGVTERVPGAP